jgi:glycosyltransferase involved in cell wall biosynthesis
VISINRILFLSSVMKMGHGVSVVLERLASELRELGWEVHIASNNCDNSNLSKNVHRIYADLDSVKKIASDLQCSTVIAVTSPFFEMLPALKAEHKTVAYEMGDPTPELFPADGHARQLIAENKRVNVYPKIDKVLTISEFLRHDIKWLQSESVYLGCDHVTDLGTKGLQDFSLGTRDSLKVGTLMRLGDGEAHYKGLNLFEDLKSRFTNQNVEFHIMGKGTSQDRASWEGKGYTVHLNATDEERSTYLRKLDVFFSPSLWEGFNLPLVEAQASGTVAVALDVGAHPEVTPFVFQGLDEIESQIRLWMIDFNLLKQNSAQAYHFARRKFAWSKISSTFSDQIESLFTGNVLPSTGVSKNRSSAPLVRHVKAGLQCLKQHGFLYTLKLIWKKAFRIK